MPQNPANWGNCVRTQTRRGAMRAVPRARAGPADAGAARARPRVRAHDEADRSPGGVGPSAEPRGGLELRIPLVEPFTATATISKPREEVFEYLADIANHPEFTDHYLVDWRLTREDSYGTGAGARFKMKAPLSRFAWGDITFV